MNPEARGSRVFLRRPTVKDARELVSLVRRSKSFLRPWVYPPEDPKRAESYLEGFTTSRSESFLLCRRSDGAVMGVVRLTEIVRGFFQNAYLSFYLGRPYSGSGYMTEGLELLLDHAFREMKLHRVEANVQPDNERSISLVRRLGFRREGFSPRYLKIGGRWRDHERWALLREEWIRGRTASVLRP